MTLAARLSVFFLATLAAVLVGFSATLYSLAHGYLHRRIDDRLEAALDVLTATAEVKRDGVEWEADERPVSLAAPPGEEPVRWVVRDDRGRVLDGPAGEEVPAEGESWRVRSRRLTAGPAPGVAGRTGPAEDDAANKSAALELTAALPLGTTAAALRNLLVLLAGLSALLWLTVALVGGRLCRRALAPVARMAESAAALKADEPGWRLPVAETRDELQDLGRAFNDLLARLHESYERQARFTGDASHQLRTPLAAMLGQIEVALRRPRSPEDYQQVLAVLRGQATQLRQIVEALLFLARADAESKSLRLERLDVRAWLGDYLATWSDHPRAADLRLDLPADGPVWVRGQSPLLAQLVDNLLENACKYSPAGTPIAVALAREAGAVALSVTDAGTGIADEDLPHLFEPFYRSAAVRRRGVPGTGLGLAVGQRVAGALGGTLRAEGGPGRGARFTLRLPPDDG